MADNKSLLHKIITTPVKSKDSGGILSKLFRKIMTETGLVNAVDSLVELYLKDSEAQSKRSGLTPKKRSQIQTAIKEEDMTWKSFIDLVINLVRVKKIVITIDLYHTETRVTTHKVEAGPNASLDATASFTKILEEVTKAEEENTAKPVLKHIDESKIKRRPASGK